jgi:hypothetical protein
VFGATISPARTRASEGGSLPANLARSCESSFELSRFFAAASILDSALAKRTASLLESAGGVGVGGAVVVEAP